MSRSTLLDVARRRVVLADGAMGTRLQAAGLEPGGPGELWNVEHPDRVEAIHRAYLAAGAEVILTNTFGGTRIALERHGLGGRAVELNRAGAEVARRAASRPPTLDRGPPTADRGPPTLDPRRAGMQPGRPSDAGEGPWVLGDIGPFGGFLAPLGEHEPADVEAAFREQADALLEGGADGILVETMTALDELGLAVRAAKAAGAPFVIGSVAYDATKVGIRTMTGATPEEAARAALDAGVDALGANCGTGLDPAAYAEVAERYRAEAGDVVVLVRPNAGTPRLRGTEVVYDATPADMAEGIRPLVEAGASIIGGCCGTDPGFIEAFARVIGDR